MIICIYIYVIIYIYMIIYIYISLSTASHWWWLYACESCERRKNNTQMTRIPTQWFPVALTKRLPMGVVLLWRQKDPTHLYVRHHKDDQNLPDNDMVLFRKWGSLLGVLIVNIIFTYHVFICLYTKHV